MKKLWPWGLSSLHLSCPLQAGKGLLCCPQFSLGELLLVLGSGGRKCRSWDPKTKAMHLHQTLGTKAGVVLPSTVSSGVGLLYRNPQFTPNLGREEEGVFFTPLTPRSLVQQRHQIIFLIHVLTPFYHPLSHVLEVRRWSFDPKVG